MREIWRDKKDYEGLYQVSNLGRVKSLNYNHTGKERLMKPSRDKDGYFVLTLSNGTSLQFKVHRLVAETFLPNPENKPCVNHKIEGDEGKTINIVYINEDGTVDEEKSTIEWATYEENNNYGTSLQRGAKARSKPVLQFTLDGEFVREYPSITEANVLLGVSPNSGKIGLCCRGKQKSAYGFKWCYA